MTPHHPHDDALRALRAFGLSLPEAHTKAPWPGHLDLAVRDKIFAHLSVEGTRLRISCKLPTSAEDALLLPFATPTGYGLGKSGWVTAEIPDDETPPVALLRAWIEESYRARAPKALVRRLEEPRTEVAAETNARAPEKRPRASRGSSRAPGRGDR